MPYYDIYDSNDNLIASNVFIEDSCYTYGSGDATGFVIVSGVIGYILALIGMIIMLFNVPPMFLFPAILAFLIFIAIPVVPLILKKPISKIVSVVVKNLYIFLNIFIGMWWILYSTDKVSEVLLIGIIVVTMYSMYIMPCLLIYEGKVLDNGKFGIIGAIVSFASALIIYLCLYNLESFSSFIPIIFSSLVTVIGTIFLLINKTIYLVKEKTKKKNVASYIIYFSIILIVSITSFIIMPTIKESRYQDAQELMSNNEYKEAREVLLSLGRYKDSKNIYETIRCKKLEVGEIIEFGCQPKKPEGFDKESLEWTVISTFDNKALLICNSIVNSLDTGVMDNYKKTNLYQYLNSLYDYFEESDKERIITQNIEFVSNTGTNYYNQNLFILSKEELFKYCNEDLIYSKKDTKYNDNVVFEWLKSDFDNEYDYSYYIRNTDDTGEWLIVNCNDKAIQRKHQEYVGIRPAVIISIE